MSGPTAVTVGGKPAQQVVIRIPDQIGCPPEQFYLWCDSSSGDARYASFPGDTIRVWIIDVNGTLLQLDGETYAGAGSGPGDELQGIIDSIRFE